MRYEDWKNLKPLERGESIDKSRRFVVIDGGCFKMGDVVEFVKDYDEVGAIFRKYHYTSESDVGFAARYNYYNCLAYLPPQTATEIFHTNELRREKLAKEGVLFPGKILNLYINGMKLRDDQILDSLNNSISLNYAINSKKTIMSTIKQIYKESTKKEPKKSFYKAGITDIDDNYTQEGIELFDDWMRDKFASEFKTEVVDVILKEQKKK